MQENHHKVPNHELIRVCRQIRRDIVRMVNGVQSGHPGGSLGCVEYFAQLFFNHLRYNPKNFTMDGIGEDLFFLSNGHISPVYYSTLARAGFFEVSELATFRKLHTRLQGHPATMEGLPGIRIATGSLGQGMSVAIGSALAKKLNNDTHLVFTLHGDGELQEGQNWEAIMFAAHHKVDNMICAIDCNNKQIDGPVNTIINIDSLKAKFEAFNWKVVDCPFGNNLDEVDSAITKAKQLTGHGQPIVILLHTKMGYGVDFMIDDHKWHGVAPNNDQLAMALNQLEETLGDYQD